MTSRVLTTGVVVAGLTLAGANFVFSGGGVGSAFSGQPKQSPASSVVRAVQAACHPSYSGACVPIASDVDCAGGRGNGPAYVRGPVRVVGPDVYRLDADGDGIGCER